MVAAASVVVAVGTATGMLSALGGDRGSDEARPPGVTASPRLEPLPAVPSPSPAEPSPSASPKPGPEKAGKEGKRGR